MDFEIFAANFTGVTLSLFFFVNLLLGEFDEVIAVEREEWIGKHVCYDSPHKKPFFTSSVKTVKIYRR